jgi:hypothetical protein
MTDCICTGPGYCERHKVKKNTHLYNICKTKQNIFDAWEKGIGPGQRKKEHTSLINHFIRYLPPPPRIIVSSMLSWAIRKAKRENKGVGTVITEFTGSIGIKSHQGCDCKSLAKRMNVVGIETIEKEFEQYVDMLSMSIRKWRGKNKINIEKMAGMFHAD